MKIVYSGVSREIAERVYAAYLLGETPSEGAYTLAGPLLRIAAAPATPFPANAAPLPGDRAAIRTTLSEDMTLRALRALREWRRLPAGIAASVSGEGILFHEGDTPVPSDETPLTFPNILDEVLAEKEIETRFGISIKEIRADCEGGVFGIGEAKKTQGGWLITRGAAEGRYGGREPQTPPLSPLLLVYATTEAAALWNRSAEDIRSAAAGAGHRAARLGDGERRRAGKLWLVTRDAMEKLCGTPAPEKWREFITSFRGRASEE